MTSNTYSVSVVIPTFNRRALIDRAIDSVVSQTYRPLEVIVVDDGSTDDTAEHVKKKYSKVIVVEQTHQGVSAARNLGIKKSRGNWIALLDSDDSWLEIKLEKQIENLKKSPDLKLCHTDEIWIRHGRRVNPKNKHQKKGGWIFRNCLPLCAISPSSVLMKRDVFDEIGLFDESLPACEDYDYWLRFCHRYPTLYLEEKLIMKYGGHEDQLSRSVWGLDRFRIRALENILQSPYLTQEDKKAAEVMLREKIKVYLNGAQKRNKEKEIAVYQEKLEAHLEASR